MFGKSRNNHVHDMILDEIKDVEACLIQFESFLCAATTPETPSQTIFALAKKLDETEGTADLSLRRMIDTLGNAPLLPATRQDLIDIATSCDKIANKCEHTASMIYCQHFLFPSNYKSDILEIFSITRNQFNLLKNAIGQLFGDFRALSNDHKILDEIRRHESHVDTIEMRLYEKTFALPVGLAEQSQLAHFVEQICDISDVIENIADKIQIMLITRKA